MGAREERVANLLREMCPGLQEGVERTCKQWNSILRDYLRAESALRLRVGDETQAVPVRVVDGLPSPFAEVLAGFDGLEWLLLNRPVIEAAARGASFLGRNLESARALWPDPNVLAQPDELRRVRETAEMLLKKLDEIDLLKRIMEIQEDVLGAYFFRVPEIQVYWMAIGIIASQLPAVPPITPEALTIAVLAHELAHAYTHLGRDIDSEQWETKAFASANLAIVEGLAQFYAQVVCKRLKPRMPEALRAYEALLARQSGAYRAHLEWVGDDEAAGEIVRVAMIECRSKRITEIERFTDAIDRHRQQVKGRTRFKRTKEATDAR